MHSSTHLPLMPALRRARTTELWLPMLARLRDSIVHLLQMLPHKLASLPVTRPCVSNAGDDAWCCAASSPSGSSVARQILAYLQPMP